MKTRTILAAFGVLAFAQLGPVAMGENWANWRGPAYNGSSPETGLPSTFSKTENVAWVKELGGVGSSSPVIWDDKVFVTTCTDNPEDMTAPGTLTCLCLNRKTGEVEWKHSIEGRTTLDSKAKTATPSPVTDGKRVVFFFGTGDLLAFDMEGKELWSEKLVEGDVYFSFLWTFSTSPVLWNDVVYLQVLQRDESFTRPPVLRGEPGKKDNPSYLRGYDADTGKVVFEHVRPAKAVAESLEAFSTPLPLVVDGRAELVIAGGDCLTGHDPKSGAELWRWGTWNPDRISHWRLVPSPVAGGGVVVICAPKKAPIYAVKAGAKGTLSQEGTAWVADADQATSDVATPAFYEGKFYAIDGDRREKALVCIDPATGKVEWRGAVETRSKIECSPTLADGKAYFVDHGGLVHVAKVEGGFEMIQSVDMSEEGDPQLRAAIAVSQGNLFVRLGNRLYCIGEGGKVASR